MLKRVTAIAGLAVQATARSRVFALLALILVVTVFAVPATVKGDGTLIGELRIALMYTLGLASAILGASNLWASCASVSQEIQEKQIRLLVTKPVHRIEVWLGKWLGLLFVNAVLLILVGGSVYCLLLWRMRPGVADQADRLTVREELLVARRIVEPRPDAAHEQAHTRLETMIEKGQVPPDAPRESLILTLENRIRAQRMTVAPGASREWRFDVPPSVGRKAVAKLRYRFSGATRHRNHVSGVWSVTDEEGTSYAHAVRKVRGGPHGFEIPREFTRPGQQLVVRFENGPRGESETAVFDFRHGAELLFSGSSFEANLVRALLIVFCRLALVAALGLTAGSVFSFPVASFVTVSMIVITALTHYFTTADDFGGCGHQHHEQQEAGILEAAGEFAMRRLTVIVSPVMTLDPLSELGGGILVKWSSAGKATAVMLVGYPAALAALAGAVLALRELALPRGT